MNRFFLLVLTLIIVIDAVKGQQEQVALPGCDPEILDQCQRLTYQAIVGSQKADYLMMKPSHTPRTEIDQSDDSDEESRWAIVEFFRSVHRLTSMCTQAVNDVAPCWSKITIRSCPDDSKALEIKKLAEILMVKPCNNWISSLALMFLFGLITILLLALVVLASIRCCCRETCWPSYPMFDSDSFMKRDSRSYSTGTALELQILAPNTRTPTPGSGFSDINYRQPPPHNPEYLSS